MYTTVFINYLMTSVNPEMSCIHGVWFRYIRISNDWWVANPESCNLIGPTVSGGSRIIVRGVPVARQGSSGTDSAFYLKERSSLLKQSACAIEHYPIGQHSLETVSMCAAQTAGLRRTKVKAYNKGKTCCWSLPLTYVHGLTTVQGQGGAIDPPLLLYR